MTLTQVWGTLLIFILCPLLGGIPLIAWITSALTGRNLAKLGTGNIGVQAAFYHGGKLAGILAVISEASKGIAAVLLTRVFFPPSSVWELIALIAVVMGRYWMGRGAGTTNVVWGFVVHDWRVAALVLLFGGTSFTIFRNRSSGRLVVLILIPLIVALLNPHDTEKIIAAITLSGLIGWIYQKIPDDLDLPSAQASSNSQSTFRFFQGDKTIISLDRPLLAHKVGEKAATLSRLKRWGYPVPTGWVLPPGDDATPLIEFLKPSINSPLVVRSSAIGEDSETASAAGQYETVLNVTNSTELRDAINFCAASYDTPNAIQYRADRQLPEDAIAILIQEQVRSVFSGVAFSRDPMTQQGDAVVIEALPGYANRVVSGQVTPEQYQVEIANIEKQSSWIIPADLELEIIGAGDVPPGLIKQVAFLARHLEMQFEGIPQDVEWSYDGQNLWVLQSRPITTLIPIWTRKIAAEVIPGLIRPLTWSINRPLTCGVWGKIFTLVLGSKARRLDFSETATLHFSHAYFNATLLGEIFCRMGLPPESLEFLTRGTKFTKPPLLSTLTNLPGLLRLLNRELRLEKDFKRDYRQLFIPILGWLESQDVSTLSPPELLGRIDSILEALQRGTYYSIMTPLSLALRQAIFKVKDAELDHSTMPEVASMRSLQQIADDARYLLPNLPQLDTFSLFTMLAERPDGQSILQRFRDFLHSYGYLSPVGTDIAVATWAEDPLPIREIFTQFFQENTSKKLELSATKPKKTVKFVQNRLHIKGKVTEIYSKLLAELRWCFVALEKLWLAEGFILETGDIFFLELSEIVSLIAEDLSIKDVQSWILQRRWQWQQDEELKSVPFIVYGNSPPINFPAPIQQKKSQLLGIGASPGIVEGKVNILRNLQGISEIDHDTILVLPYTDSGWAPLLARAGGLISEVGGRLSHGAIVAREYGIPAVMDIHNATQILRNGQRVRIDGKLGIVEIL